MRTSGLGLVVAAALVLGQATGANAADPPVADFAMEWHPAVAAEGPNDAEWLASIRTKMINRGPNTTMLGDVTSDVLAPGGTEFITADSAYNPVRCTVLVPKRHVRCRLPFMVQPDSVSPALWGTTDVRVLSNCPTPGRMVIEYPGDPDPSNNSAPLVVTKPGFGPAQCSAKPTSRPTSRPVAGPTANTVAATSPAEPPSPSPAPSAPGASGTPLRIEGNELGAPPGSGSPSSVVLLVAAGGGVLVVAGALAALVALRRRRLSGRAGTSGPGE